MVIYNISVCRWVLYNIKYYVPPPQREALDIQSNVPLRDKSGTMK